MSCRELGVNPEHVQKIRKLPNTILRKVRTLHSECSNILKKPKLLRFPLKSPRSFTFALCLCPRKLTVFVLGSARCPGGKGEEDELHRWLAL